MGLLTYGESSGMPSGGLLNMDDPNMQLMLAGLTMMANKRGANAQNAIPMGINQFMQMRGATQNAQNDKLDREMKMKEYEFRMNEMQRQQADRQKMDDAYSRLGDPSGYMKTQDVTTERPVYSPAPPIQGAVAPNFGMTKEMVPTTTQATVFDKGAQMRDMWAIPKLRDKLIEQQFAGPQERDYFVAPDGSLIDKKTGQKAEGNYAKPEDSQANPNKPFMLVDGKVVPNQAYQDYEINKAKAGAASNTVSVNTGQKGFDNTLKLRGDFRSEPIYKAHQEVKSAYAQIGAALKKNSPAGDLAGATKIMKLLDPGSVVRESELGMAMAASGALDRITNYADMTIRGTKLTPEQRKDFQGLADSLFSESANQYNAKRGEYEGIAKRNDLGIPDVVGDAEKMPTLAQQQPKTKPATGTAKSKQFDIGGKKVLGTLGADGNYYVTQGGKKYRVEE